MSMVLFAFGDTETVTNVRGVQRENSKLVDIYYDLNATDYGTYTIGVEIEGRTIAVTATTFTGDVGEGVTPGTNRHILWDAGTDWPSKKGDVKAVVTATKEDPSISHGKVQLWEGGPYWADRNIGADNPWDYGLYFWWGDTTGHRPSGTTFSFSFYSAPTYGMTPSILQNEGWIVSQNGTYVLVPSHDAAHVKWGGGWRMPTNQELTDLCSKCDWTWTTKNGVYGYIVQGRGTYFSNSIFLPAAGEGEGISLRDAGSIGYYWSSVPHPGSDSWGSRYLGFAFDHGTYHSFRDYGRSVRPVQEFSK